MKPIIVPMLIMLLGLTATPAAAQDSLQRRVDQLEREVRAVQRKVFPGGSSEFFEADIQPPSAAAPAGANAPTPGAVSDLIVRVDALEAQLAALTGQIEENGFRLQQMEGRLAALEASAAPPPIATSETSSFGGDDTGGAESILPATSAADTPPPERIEGVAAIIKPETGDPAEDAYIYGYRLWEAKFYPEAQAQLEQTVKDFPNHRRASFAQNLWGRSLLDNGQPGLSTRVFLDNYQKMPRGERAAESLYFLGVALTQLREYDRACRAFDELASAYPEEAAGRLSDRLALGRGNARCS